MIHIAGLDQSFTSFGMARIDGGAAQVQRVRCGKSRGHERMSFLLGSVRSWCAGCDVVVLEGLAFGAKGNALLDLAGLSWLIRHELYLTGIPYALVPPTSRAKWLTGSGNADKDACLIAALKRFPGADLTGNDEADALTLAAMGASFYGSPIAQMPADRDAVLTATSTAKAKRGQPVIDWPKIERRPAA